jgi:hypothetical protein
MTNCTGAGGGGTGTQYTYAQLEGLWINAGGPAEVAPIAAAVAMAESGGCSSALNPTDNGGTQTSVGLWQVSNGTHDYPAAWATASGNATEAVSKYTAENNSFSPAWGTFDSGAYKGFLSNGTTPDTNVPGSGSTSATTTASTGSADCLLGFPGVSVPVVGSVGGFCMLSKSEARALIGALCLAAGGLAFVIGALVVAAGAIGDTKTGQAAMSAAGKAAEIIPFIPPI